MCDPSIEFQAGQIAELTVIGNQVFSTVSSGRAPLGIIDDMRTKSFTNVSWNEEVVIPIASPSGSQSHPTVPYDSKTELRKANIVSSSFTSTVPVELNANNGVITFLAGTPLNIDLDGDGILDGIRAVVNYTYYIANIPGEDTTMGSGQMTVWIDRGIYATSIYETNQPYAIRANLFVSEKGILTSRQPSSTHPAVAQCVGVPSAVDPYLHFLWF